MRLGMSRTVARPKASQLQRERHVRHEHGQAKAQMRKLQLHRKEHGPDLSSTSRPSSIIS